MGYVPWSHGLFGQGGGKRNSLKRDNLSAKYALCAMGYENEGVVKFSDTFGKTTLPGPFKILRSEEALNNKKQEGFDILMESYNLEKSLRGNLESDLETIVKQIIGGGEGVQRILA